MSKEEVCQPRVCGKTSCQKTQSILAHLIVRHVNLLDVYVSFEGLSDWFNLLVSQLVFHKVEVFQRKDLEQLSQSLSTDFVVVNLNILELFILLLKHLY